MFLILGLSISRLSGSLKAVQLLCGCDLWCHVVSCCKFPDIHLHEIIRIVSRVYEKIYFYYSFVISCFFCIICDLLLMRLVLIGV